MQIIENLFFDNWFSFCSSSFFDKYIFFFSIALIYFIGAAVAARVSSPDTKSAITFINDVT
mgnify:CR=1 FL=1